MAYFAIPKTAWDQPEERARRREMSVKDADPSWRGFDSVFNLA